MPFSIAERLQIAILCDLGKAPKDRELDLDFIGRAVANGDLWAITWRYPGLQLDEPEPPAVQHTCDILDMWSVIERSYANLPKADQTALAADKEVGVPRFQGFDGNTENALHIANLLVNKLDRWEEFKGRSLNSHFPSLEMHERLLAVYKPIWEATLANHGGYQLTAEQLRSILREHIHPQYRAYAPDGSWTFNDVQ